MSARFFRLVESTQMQGEPSRDKDGLWTHPYPVYAPDPRKKRGVGAVDWYQQVIGLPGGEGFAAEGDDSKERLRAERDTWGVPNGQDPDVEEANWGFEEPSLGKMKWGFQGESAFEALRSTSMSGESRKRT